MPTTAVPFIRRIELGCLRRLWLADRPFESVTDGAFKDANHLRPPLT